MGTSRIGVAFLAIVLLVAPGAARAVAPLIGHTPDSVLYDIDPFTGQASNPRDAFDGQLVGIDFGPDAKLYGLSTAFFGSTPNSLLRIDPATGDSDFIGDTGLQIAEGDLAFHPTTGVLYGVQPTGIRTLFTIDIQTGAATVVGTIPGAQDLSALSFDLNGTLYAIDTTTDDLLTLDPSNAQVLTSVSLNVGLGVAAGMDVDPETGTLYVADGALSGSGTNKLYTLEPATGVLTEIGTTVPDVGLSGLAFIPEPSAVLLLLAAGPMVRRLSRRRARV